ncbi:P-loop NTPase fold protein [Sphingobacterium sp.]|uniref:KAP family P-loop NTPase fold protein n=1 Tax=Sphingobacterium sp. TaxID=341027 RepID=UPI0028AFC805|nr:P-loop NTPase fold protein [Sphingobacterium sp.]
MKLDDFLIDINDPFKDCQLNRKTQADALLKLIPGFDKGGVIALNNKWGTGKTTFIKMFDAYLHINGYNSIYFNAWENDFEDNPLSALIAELKENFKNNKKADDVVKYGAKLFLDVGSKAISHQLDKYIGNDTIKTISEAVNRSTKELFEKELKDYAEKKDSLIKFKQSLEQFVADNSTKTPLLFFIDELDRCRPNYAVKVLECIKHLFAVPNILFVLSIDKIQLRNAINGFYGSEKFDSEEYLLRFIDLEYSLPNIGTENFIIYQLDSYGLIKYYSDHIDARNYILKHTCILLFKDLTLRKIEKIILHLNVILKQIKFEETNILLLLLFFKFTNFNLYNKISQFQLTLKEVHDEFYKAFLFTNLSSIDKNKLSVIEADFLWLYFDALDTSEQKADPLYTEVKLEIQLNYISKFNNNLFVTRIKEYERSYSVDIKKTIEIIDLIN